MNYDDIQFGDYDPEHDFSQDITGKFYPSSNDKTDQPSETGLPDNFWFQNSPRSSFISNNDLPGIAHDKFGENVKSNEDLQVINKAYVLAMRGADAFQLERVLKLSFSDIDFQSKSYLRNSLFILPMFGPIFWSCRPFPTEEEARQEMRRKTGAKPVLVSESSKCGTCQFKNSISPKTIHCSKLGLPIFDNDFKSPPPPIVISRLSIGGYLPETKKNYCWDDIRKAIIFPPENNAIQIYKQYAPSKKEVLPGAQYRKGLLALNRMNYEKQAQEEKYNRDCFILSVCYPLITKVQESFLKNKQNDTAIDDYLQKILLPDNYKSECLQIVDSLKKDILLWAGVRFYLSSYQKCDDAEEFLHRNNLRVPYGVQRQDCTFCIDNKSGFCKRLECRLVPYKADIPLKDVLNRIEILGSDYRLNRQLIEFWKSLEVSNPLSGLKKLREALKTPQTVSEYTGAGLQDLNSLPNKQLSKESAQRWIENKLAEDNSVLRIEATIKKSNYLRNGTVCIQDAILNSKIKPSDKNDLCLTDYQIDPSHKLKRLNKCKTCSYASTVHCSKYNQPFSEAFNEIPQEFKEIMNVFHDSPMEVEVDPLQRCNTIDVELENPGEALDVNVKVEKSLNEQMLWQEAQSQKMEIDSPAPIEFDSYIDIDMGEPGDGMILDDTML